jgi:hypothetical protein
MPVFAAAIPPRSALATALALAWALAGCGGELPTAEGFPAPGELQVVSIRPVGDEREASLLPNGSFEDYYAGAPGPTGPYVHPAPDIGHSTIQRSDAQPAEGRFAVAQEWRASDWEDAVDDLFGATIEGLRPQTAYTFRAQADPGEGLGGTIMLYFVREGGGYEPFHEIVVEPGAGFRTYSATFNTGPYTRLRIATLGPWQEGAYPSTILWDDWQLARATQDEIDSIAELPMAGLLPNGSFEVWFYGASAPSGGYVPPAPALGHGQVDRIDKNLADGKYALKQTWTGSDSEDPVSALFGITLTGLAPNTPHRLRVRANTLGEGSGQIEVHGVGKPPAELLLLAAQPLQTAAGYREYTLEFDSGEHTSIRIATRGPKGDATYPNRVLWDDWHLEPVQ